MRTVTVLAPDGTSWGVRVVWEPRWRAMARRYGGWRRRRQDGQTSGSGLPDLSGIELPVSRSRGWGFWNSTPGEIDDIVVGIAIVVGVIVFGLLFWWLLLPLLLLVLDAVVVAILLVAGIAGRVLLRRPWTVEASDGAETRVAARVVGWRAALRVRDEMADRLRAGGRPADVALRYAS